MTAFRSSLKLRLLGLLAGAILPALAALLYMQVDLRQERVERVEHNALNQAHLLSAEVETLVDGARQLSLALAQSQALPAGVPGCQARLDALRRALSGYAFLAVLNDHDEVTCAAVEPGAAVTGAGWTADLAGAQRAGRFTVGHFTVLPGGAATLPMFLPFTTAGGARATIVSAIDLPWLDLRLGRFLTAPHNTINIADATGTVLVRLPQPERWRGRKIAPDARVLIGAASPGARMVQGLDGVTRLVGYVPAVTTGGLYVAAGIYLPDMLAGIDNAARRGYLLLALGAAASVLLMLAITRRLVHEPTQALLHAAARWNAGDLAARARLHAPEHTEFGQLGASFNMMAGSLQARRRELQDLNASLEARVEQRTQALSDTNNRLAVEISERERTDAVLRQSQKLRAVGHLAGGMAHEFNNLLTTVLGALELLRVRLGPEHRYGRLIDSANEAARRGGRLTAQLLAFSRRKGVVTDIVDLNTVLADMRDLIGSTLGGSVTLRFNLAPTVWPALASRNEAEAAILNLVLNARDAMCQGPGGQGTLTIATCNATLPDHADPPADAVLLTIRDDGIGMTEDELSHAVDPFFTTKKVGDGVGLGLSQVHGFATQLGGTLHIESAPACGTEVRLYLPRAIVGACHPAGMPAPLAAGHGALLLVDDDAAVRQIAAAMLAEIGFEVVQASCGREALSLIGAAPASFSTLVADYAMPEMTGADLIRVVRKSWPSIRPLLITGFMEFNAADTDLLAARQVLRKPFTLSELRGRLDELATGVAV